MAWQIYDPSAISRKTLRDDQCRLRGDGAMLLTRAAVEAAGLSKGAVALFDLEGARIALRPPEADEARMVIKCMPAADPKTTTCLMFRVKGVMSRAGWVEVKGKSKKLRYVGNHPLVKRSDGLLICKLDESKDQDMEPESGEE